MITYNFSEFRSKILTQTVRVPKLLDGAKYWRKVQPRDRYAPASQTDRQTDRQICDDIRRR